jgi:hypothetical protein
MKKNCDKCGALGLLPVANASGKLDGYYCLSCGFHEKFQLQLNNKGD